MIAKIQSTESSNSIEGIVTTKPRMRELVKDKTTANEIAKTLPSGKKRNYIYSDGTIRDSGSG